MKNKDITLLLVSIFILISAWVIFNIFHSAATSTISEALNRNITPISPNFDIKTIDNLKKRAIVPPIYSINASSPSSNTTINQVSKEATQESSLKL